MHMLHTVSEHTHTMFQNNLPDFTNSRV